MRAARPSPEAEIESFFALPRRVLYVGALAILVALGGFLLAAEALVSRGLGQWAIPVIPLAGLFTTALLSRSVPGRGCLRTVGLGWIRSLSKFEPGMQTVLWAIASVIGLAIAVVMTGR